MYDSRSALCVYVSVGLHCVCMCVIRSALCVHVCQSVCIVCACVSVGLHCVHVSLNKEMIKCVPTFEWSHILNMCILSNKINIFYVTGTDSHKCRLCKLCKFI